MTFEFPNKFPTTIPIPFEIPRAVVEDIATSRVGAFQSDGPWGGIHQLTEAHNKLQEALSYFLLSQNLPSIINSWSVELVDDLIKKHKIDRSAFEVDRIVQYLNQAMWSLLQRDRDFITQSLGIRPIYNEWLCKKRDSSAQKAIKALAEYALMMNGGVKIPDGRYTSLVEGRRYSDDDGARRLLRSWVNTLGDIKPLPAPKVKQEAKVSVVTESNADVW